MDPIRPVSGQKNKSTNFRKCELDAVIKNGSPKDRGENLPLVKNNKLFKKSMIPRLQPGGIHYKKEVQKKPKKTPLPPKNSTPTVDQYNTKLQKLEEKENAIAEFYTKIEALIRQLTKKKSGEKLVNKYIKKKIFLKNGFARKMCSDPTVSKNTICNKNKDDFSEFESCAHEISDIWLKTSADSTPIHYKLNEKHNTGEETLHHEPSNDEFEKVKIQKIVRRARSLSLIKTPNVTTEAMKTLAGDEKLQKKHRNICSWETQMLSTNPIFNEIKEISLVRHQKESLSEIQQNEVEELKEIESVAEARIEENFAEETDIIETVQENTRKDHEPIECHGEAIPEKINDSSIEAELSTWAEELAKSEKLATRLKSRIYDLQNTYNEYSLKCNDLQLRLVNFSKKIHWDQILMNKIEKLNDVQQRVTDNEDNVESEGKQLEFKIRELDEELDILVQTNFLLLQQKFLLDHQNQFIDQKNREYAKHEEDRLECFDNLIKRCETAEKIFTEKKIVIDQLKGILNVMSDQKKLADKHKSLMEAKIKALKKARKII